MCAKDKKQEYICIESTGWHHINLEAIANFEDDIIIKERIKNEKEKCYTKKIIFTVTSESWKDFYELAKHIEGDCDGQSEGCKYCMEEREELL